MAAPTALQRQPEEVAQAATVSVPATGQNLSHDKRTAEI